MLKSAERNAARGAAAQLSRFGGMPPSSSITSSTWRNFAAVTVWPVARSHRASQAAMATAQPSVRNLATLIMPSATSPQVGFPSVAEADGAARFPTQRGW